MHSGQQNRHDQQNNQHQGSRGSRTQDSGQRNGQRAASGRASNDYRDERGYTERDLTGDRDFEQRASDQGNSPDHWPDGAYDAGMDSGYGRDPGQRDRDQRWSQQSGYSSRSQGSPQRGSDRNEYGGIQSDWESGIRGGRSSYNAGVDSMWTGGGQSFREQQYDRNGDWQTGGQSGMQSARQSSGAQSSGAQSAGNHRGKGPKGYQRSDERITEDISERLADHSEVDASDIEVKVEQGEVTLTGTAQDRNTKRMAEDIAEGVSGVKEVHNQIRVSRGQDSSSQTGQKGDHESSSASGSRKQNQHETAAGKR